MFLKQTLHDALHGIRTRALSFARAIHLRLVQSRGVGAVQLLDERFEHLLGLNHLHLHQIHAGRHAIFQAFVQVLQRLGQVFLEALQLCLVLELLLLYELRNALGSRLDLLAALLHSEDLLPHLRTALLHRFWSKLLAAELVLEKGIHLLERSLHGRQLSLHRRIGI